MCTDAPFQTSISNKAQCFTIVRQLAYIQSLASWPSSLEEAYKLDTRGTNILPIKFPTNQIKLKLNQQQEAAHWCIKIIVHYSSITEGGLRLRGGVTTTKGSIYDLRLKLCISIHHPQLHMRGWLTKCTLIESNYKEKYVFKQTLRYCFSMQRRTTEGRWVGFNNQLCASWVFHKPSQANVSIRFTVVFARNKLLPFRRPVRSYQTKTSDCHSNSEMYHRNQKQVVLYMSIVHRIMTVNNNDDLKRYCNKYLTLNHLSARRNLQTRSQMTEEHSSSIRAFKRMSSVHYTFEEKPTNSDSSFLSREFTCFTRFATGHIKRKTVICISDTKSNKTEFVMVSKTKKKKGKAGNSHEFLSVIIYHSPYHSNYTNTNSSSKIKRISRHSNIILVPHKGGRLPCVYTPSKGEQGLL